MIGERRMNAPKIIYLQHACNDNEYCSEHATHCEDKINKDDVKYIRADLVVYIERRKDLKARRR